MFKYSEYVYKVYEEGSFTAAAKKLFISQPALSFTIKKAEEELGFAIFDRSTSPLTVTDAGKVYIEAVEQKRKIERNLKNYIENINSLNVGDISVSGASFISSFILPEIIMKFSDRYPNINILLIESNSANLQERLLSEEIEILVDYDFDQKLFETFPLKKEHILLAVPKKTAKIGGFEKLGMTAEDIKENKHLSRSVESLNIKALENEKFILLKNGNNMQKISGKIFSENGISPNIQIKVDQLMTAYNIASSGMGITFTTDTVICSAADSGKLLFYKCDSKFAERTLCIAHKMKTYVSPAVKEFIKVAKEIYKYDEVR